MIFFSFSKIKIYLFQKSQLYLGLALPEAPNRHHAKKYL
jgi:hypothetical protein